jgi:hypothetical protein
MFTGMKEILIQRLSDSIWNASSDGKRSFVAGFSAKQIMKLLLYCLSCVLKIVTMNAELSLSPLIQKKNELKFTSTL